METNGYNKKLYHMYLIYKEHELAESRQLHDAHHSNVPIVSWSCHKVSI